MSVFGDIIILKDGTTLTGKIVKKTSERIHFTNSHGRFEIKKKLIANRIVTESFKDDIKFLKRKKVPYKKKEVEINFDFGLRDLRRVAELQNKKDITRDSLAKKIIKKRIAGDIKHQIGIQAGYPFILGYFHNRGAALRLPYTYSGIVYSNNIFKSGGIIPYPETEIGFFRFGSSTKSRVNESTNCHAFPVTLSARWDIDCNFILPKLFINPKIGIGYMFLYTSLGDNRNVYSSLLLERMGINFSYMIFHNIFASIGCDILVAHDIFGDNFWEIDYFVIPMAGIRYAF